MPVKNLWEATAVFFFDTIRGWNLEYAMISCPEVLTGSEHSSLSVRDRRKPSQLVCFSCSLKSRLLPWYNPLTSHQGKERFRAFNGKAKVIRNSDIDFATILSLNLSLDVSDIIFSKVINLKGVMSVGKAIRMSYSGLDQC